MTYPENTIYFNQEVKAPVLTAEEARILLDHLDHVQAASLLGDRWTVWCQAKGKLVSIEYDGSKS